MAFNTERVAEKLDSHSFNKTYSSFKPKFADELNETNVSPRDTIMPKKRLIRGNRGSGGKNFSPYSIKHSNVGEMFNPTTLQEYEMGYIGFA